MGAHNIPAKLTDPNAVFPASGRSFYVEGVGFMLAWGTTVPADGATGYGKGCIFMHTDATDNTDVMYSNIGDEDTANFNAATVAADA
ncbi:MAG: hypothetical protein Q7T18_02800 [Sedimentisphaerales bacterium]|nr:hypothetical protein [Sedimentisphaerales bacterium]